MIQGNFIGTDPSGTLNVGNADEGVLVSTNGSGAQIIGNLIAFNGGGASGGEGAGVQINSGSSNGNGNLISQNSILSNVGIGIELGAEGALPIQAPPPAGPNNSQNYPILFSATAVSGGTQIQGSLTSIAGHTFRLEFFANAARDPTTFSDALTVLPGEFSEGQTYIGSLTVPVGASGNANFTANLPALPAGEPFVTATATDITNPGSGPANNTSGFSPVVALGGPSYVVTNTGDSGLGTLREAIYDADNTPGSHTITFDIPATDPRHFYYANDGVAGQVSQTDIATTTAVDDSAITNIDPDWTHSWYSIEPASPLPPLFDVDSINGYSQPGSGQNTSPAVQQGLNTVLKIEIDGQNVTGDGLALVPSGPSDAVGTSTIQGLAINNFNGNGITLSSESGDTIAGNFIGLDISGTLDLGNGGNGIYVENVNNFTIGGSSNAAANLISANGANGIYIYEDGNGGAIDGNLIGGGRSLALNLPNAQGGVDIETSAATIADVAPAEPGLAFSAEGGFKYLEFAFRVVGSKPDSFNFQTFGLWILAGFIQPSPTSADGQASALISSESATAGPAIDLEDGANSLTNAPVLTSATAAPNTTVTGTLSSQADATYLIQFYSNTQLLPAGYGPGDQYIGSVEATTNAAGNGSFMFQSPTSVPTGQNITATATLLNSNGNPQETSEFSAGILVGTTVQQQPPPSPPTVTSVSTTKLIKRHKNQGTITVTINFSEPMAALADASTFYELGTPKKERVHGKVKTKLVPVHFKASSSGANSVSLKLKTPTKQHLTLIVMAGDPGANGLTIGQNVTIIVQ